MIDPSFVLSRFSFKHSPAIQGIPTILMLGREQAQKGQQHNPTVPGENARQQLPVNNNGKRQPGSTE